MNTLLLLSTLWPLVAFLGVVILRSTSERWIIWKTKVAVLFQGAGLLALTLGYFLGGLQTTHWESPAWLIGSTEFEFRLASTGTSLSLAGLGTVIFFLVAQFSKTYLHREQGFKRFFATLLLFLLSYQIVVFADNLETLLMGWEVLGITSFLLIGFFRERYHSVKNALKTLTYYRLADIGLLFSIWLLHTHFHGENTLSAFHHFHISADHMGVAWGIGLGLLLAAAVKSGQFPFSAWVPRAMEGPSTSSALFYGALSLHIGAILLLKTADLWQQIPGLPWIVAAMGGVTALVGSAIARYQSSIKTQIAYMALAQIGLIFIELALGWTYIAVFHIASHAIFRAYQLLVSSSIQHYKLHQQFFGELHSGRSKSWIPSRWHASLLTLSIQEFRLDRAMRSLLWKPFKAIGRSVSFLGNTRVVIGLGVVGVLGFGLEETGWGMHKEWLAIALSAFALLLVLASVAERRSVTVSWNFVVVAQFFILAATAANKPLTTEEWVIYLSGPIVAAIWGHTALYLLKKEGAPMDLKSFYGSVHDHPHFALGFLISALAMGGFPITPTFFGVDVVLNHDGSNQWILVCLQLITFFWTEVAALRIYSRVFTGPFYQLDRPVSYKNS